MDTVKIVVFRMLPRGAQIEKVRAELNSGLLKKYGRMTGLEIDKENRIISAELELKGEKESVRIDATLEQVAHGKAFETVNGRHHLLAQGFFGLNLSMPIASGRHGHCRFAKRFKLRDFDAEFAGFGGQFFPGECPRPLRGELVA
jgi:hypothetical protein